APCAQLVAAGEFKVNDALLAEPPPPAPPTRKCSELFCDVAVGNGNSVSAVPPAACGPICESSGGGVPWLLLTTLPTDPGTRKPAPPPPPDADTQNASGIVPGMPQ